MITSNIAALIKKDKWMMDILETVEKLNLPDWWIGAGFVRGKVWDYLHEYKKRTELPDVDVIFFDKSDFNKDEMQKFSTKKEKEYQKILKIKMPSVNWSVTNQARMHLFHKSAPYKTSEEALSHWVETATCVGVKLEKGKLILTAPHGIEDLVNLVVRPTEEFKDGKEMDKRIRKKQWLKKWPKLKVIRI